MISAACTRAMFSDKFSSWESWRADYFLKHTPISICHRSILTHYSHKAAFFVSSRKMPPFRCCMREAFHSLNNGNNLNKRTSTPRRKREFSSCSKAFPFCTCMYATSTHILTPSSPLFKHAITRTRLTELYLFSRNTCCGLNSIISAHCLLRPPQRCDSHSTSQHVPKM